MVHELGHIRNRDIDQTYLAVAVWWAFVVAALLPMAGLLISGKLSPPAPLIWRAVVLALLVYLLRNSILRSREFGADARVAELDPDTSLGQVLAGQPPRRGWRSGTWAGCIRPVATARRLCSTPRPCTGAVLGRPGHRTRRRHGRRGRPGPGRTFPDAKSRHGPDTGVYLRAVFRGRPDRGYVADAAPARRDGDRGGLGRRARAWYRRGHRPGHRLGHRA